MREVRNEGHHDLAALPGGGTGFAPHPAAHRAAARGPPKSVTPRINAGGGRSTAESDKIAAFVAAITELEADLRGREQARRVEVAAACVLLDRLPETEGAVLHQYYVQRRKIHNIAAKMGYTDSYICRLKAAGERILNNMEPEIVRSALPNWYLREWPEKGAKNNR